MSAVGPQLSVVVATRNRARRLAALLGTLRAQTLERDRFEVIVVDDASSDETSSVLDHELRSAALDLRVLALGRAHGPAAARNHGWRAAIAPLIAFIDDDCVASPEWLEQGLRACARGPGAIVQGRVDPIPEEQPEISPFTRTLTIHAAGPYYQTCNILYPRALLEALGGFDTFFRMPGGEDTDLAWRAIARGVPTAFAPEARVFHAVNHLGPLGRLRLAAHWHESMIVYKRHPELREAVFVKHVFWKRSHYALMKAALALLLPARLGFLRPGMVLPYVRNAGLRCQLEHGGRAHLLFYPVEDLVEVLAMVRASLEHRMLVL